MGENETISERGNFLRNGKIICEEDSWNLLKSYLLEAVWRVLIKKKWGGNRKKMFYSEKWGNAV